MESRQRNHAIWKRMVAATASIVMFGAGLATTGTALAADNEPYTLGADGLTAVKYDANKTITEHAYVQTNMDSDHDGKKDLVRIDIVRPGTPSGVQVPSVIYASGYNGAYPDKVYRDAQNSDTSDMISFPPYSWISTYFGPRGYAYVLPDLAGTNWSEGCADLIGPHDIESVAAVTRWLHHDPDTPAYRNLDRKEAVSADWSNGNSAEIGKSYDGAVTNAVATSPNVRGLKTIIPISGGSSSFNSRENGVFSYRGNDPANFSRWITNPNDATLPARLQEHQKEKATQCEANYTAMDKQLGDDRTYNDFWDQRNYAKKVDQIKKNGIAVFEIMGTNDMTVRTNELDQYWAALQKAGVPSKLWLHQRGHARPNQLDIDKWLADLHPWLDHYLYGIDNGVENGPKVSVENEPKTADATTPSWTDYASWPVPGTKATTFGFSGDGQTALGDLARGSSNAAGDGDAAGKTVTIKAGSHDDSVTINGLTTDATPGDGTIDPADSLGADKALFVTEPLAQDTHISGTPSIRLKVKAGAGDQLVSAALVDFGTAPRINAFTSADTDDYTDAAGVRLLKKENVTVGEARDGETNQFPKALPVITTDDAYTITRSTVTTAHYQGLDKYTPAPTDAYVDMQWDVLATDYVVPAGHRLGVMIYNNSTMYSGDDEDITYEDADGNQVTEHFTPNRDFSVDLSASSISIPIVDNAAIVSVDAPKAVTAEYGKAPQLPSTVTAHLAGGSAKQVAVTWKTTGVDWKSDVTVHGEVSGWDAGVDIPVKVEGQPEPEPSLRFTDVVASTPHRGDIEWLAEKGISTGWSTGENTAVFSPMGPVVRQDMAAFLYRLAGSPEYTPSDADKTKFTDVNESTPHYKEVLWLASTGIAEGFRQADGSFQFGGNRVVVRQDMAAFLKRLADLKGARPSLGEYAGFTDVDATSPHHDEIVWLARTGVAGGYEDGTFGGMRLVVRQDMAAFLHRMDANVLTTK